MNSGRLTAGRISMVKRTPADDDQEASDQDDPKNAAEIERLRAKLIRHQKEAERLAELIRRKQRSL
jgi:hypothetical protein